MAVKVEVSYSKTLSGNKPLADSLQYFSKLDVSIPENFLGLETFRPVKDNVYDWAFEKFSYGGYDFQIQFQTQFKFAGNNVEIIPYNAKGTELHGRWEFSESNGGTTLKFSARFVTELGIPFFLKSMATSLVQKELTRLFDRYSDNVAKVLSI